MNHTKIIYVERFYFGDIKIYPETSLPELYNLNYIDMMSGSTPRFKLLPFDFSHLPHNQSIK